MTVNIPTNIHSMTLRQFLAYGNVMRAVYENDNELEKIDRFSLAAPLCEIAFGSDAMQSVISVGSIDKIFIAVISAINNVFDGYIDEVKQVNYVSDFSFKHIDHRGRKVKARYFIDQNIPGLPAEIWGQILSRVERIDNNTPVFIEIENIPFIISRIAWESKRDMFVKDVTGRSVINQQAISEKSDLFLDANAVDMIRAYVFFLILKGVYSTAPSFLSSKRKLTTRISNLQTSVSNMVNDGDGLDSLRTLSQKEMMDFLSKN